MAVRWGNDIIVIDAGLMFPESELLGVDIVVPDISYLLANREKVRGIILTHGHEDHIGGLPWVLSELKVPVFGTEFTLALVENKLEEHSLLDDADLREIRAGDVVWIPPGEKHWHGAGPTTVMMHVAMQEALDGKHVEWLEPVTDEQYKAAVG